MKKMNFYFNRIGAMVALMLTMVASQVSAQCPPINFSYPAGAGTCDATAVLVVPGLTSVQVKLDNGTWATEFTPAYIGRTIEYRGVQFSGQMCWSMATIEDKAGPVITAPADITLQCTQAGSIKNLDVTGELSNNNGIVVNRAGNDGPFGSYLDCIKGEQSYSDRLLYNGGDCAGLTAATDYTIGDGTTYTAPVGAILVIERKWSAKDFYKNESNVDYQVITVVRNVAGWAIRDTSLACTATAAQTAYRTAANGRVNPQRGSGIAGPFFNVGEGAIVPVTNASGVPVCGVSATWLRDETLVICTGTTKIVRYWRVTNLCAAGTMTTDVTQIITLKDEIKPVITANWRNTLRKEAGIYRWEMTNGTSAMCMDEKRYNLVNMDSTRSTTATDTTIWIRPLAMSHMCRAASVSFTVSATDQCGAGAAFMSSDSRFTISAAGVVSGTVMFPAGSDEVYFNIMATDPCGNIKNLRVGVIYTDNVAPNVDCDIDGLKATLDENGNARLYATQFDRGTRDNCGIKRIYVKRADTVSTCANPWREFVDFSCSDLTGNGTANCTSGRHMVFVRFQDVNDNFSDCMVEVVVEDKKGPNCMSPADVSIPCNDARALNLAAQFTTPLAFDNCGIVRTDSTPFTNPSVRCGGASASRTWTFYDCGGRSTACSQTITLTAVNGFRLKTQGDQTVECTAPAGAVIGSTAWLEAEKDRTVRDLILQNCDGVKTCSAPIVEVEAWEFRSSQYCKIYRVRYTVIDECAPFYNYRAPIWGRVPGTNNYNIQGTDAPQGTNVGCISNESTPYALTGRRDTIQDYRLAVVYERFINVEDRTAPTSSNRTISLCDNDATDTDTDNCEFGFSVTLAGQDDCGTGTAASTLPDAMTFMWRLLRADGTEVTSNTGATVSRNNLPFGTYRLVYRVTDLCANMSQEYTVTITGLDCKAPEILVHNKIVALGGQVGTPSSGMATVHNDDIKNAIRDNCDATLNRDKISAIRLERATTAAGADIAAGASPSVAAGTISHMFTCADLASSGVAGAYVSTREHKIRVWAVDASGNWNHATSTITLQDNDGICTPRTTVQGLIANEAGTNVDNVTVNARVNGNVLGTAPTAANGSYSVSIAARGVAVQVAPSKTVDTDAREGVSTADIAAISRHILGSQSLATPYSIIAADVDKNGTVEAADMLQIRRFVLFISPALPAGNFRFVDNAYAFRNAAEPLGEDFPEVVNIANANGTHTANFTAIKLGDVNRSYRNVSARGSRNLTLTATDMEVVAGNEYTVNVNAANFDAAAFQGTFSFNGAAVKAIKAGSLAGMSDANFGMVNNAVTASWNGKAAGAAEVVAITFVANKSGKLSDMMTFGSALTASEAVATNGEVLNATLKFNTGKVSGNEFALFQNTPNPVATSTKVAFNLPKDGAARFTVFNAEGKVVFARNAEFKAGYNEITLNKSELAAGVLYYRLETADHSATKKMIIIE